METEVIDSVLEKAEEESVKFWSKSDKGVIKAIPIVFKKFLEDNGFYKYCPEGSQLFFQDQNQKRRDKELEHRH